MTLFIEDGVNPCWKEHKNYPPLEYKHLERDKFEELLDLMIEAYPDHELTHWLKRGFCMNEGDSTMAFCSLEGRKVLQWDIDHFDEEDEECFEQWFGDAEELEWDDDWDDE